MRKVFDITLSQDVDVNLYIYDRIHTVSFQIQFLPMLTNYKEHTVLLVSVASECFEKENVLGDEYKLLKAHSIQNARQLFSEQDLDLVVLDLDFDEKENMFFLRELVNIQKDCIFVVVKKEEQERSLSIEENVRFSCITKPYERSELKAMIGRLLEIRHLRLENQTLYRERASLQLALEKQQRISQQSHYAVLKSQVNPHFLLNCLNTLYSVVVENPKAKNFVLKLSKVYRYILTFHQKTLITLEKELKLVEDYIFLQKVRLGNSVKVEWDVATAYLEYEIPPLAIQTLVENAIKHNVATISNPLTIRLYTTGNDELVVENNYQKRRTPANSTGIGQQNLLARYRSLIEREPHFYIENEHYYARIPLIQ